jgi:hypothetical protein
MVISLAAAMLLFGIAVQMVNTLFTQAVAGAGGGATHSSVGFMGVIAYTVIYVALIYSLLNTCLHLIDFVPNNALRWMGGSAAHPHEHDHHGFSQAAMGAAAGAAFAGGKGGAQGLNSGVGKNRAIAQQQQAKEQGALSHMTQGGGNEASSRVLYGDTATDKAKGIMNMMHVSGDTQGGDTPSITGPTGGGTQAAQQPPVSFGGLGAPKEETKAENRSDAFNKAKQQLGG